jgi:2,4-didehydro-3-deoxy-L-rhamnonate hydrolase
MEPNGNTMQREGASNMLFGIAQPSEYSSERAPLLPGDIFSTGSSAGDRMHHNRFLTPGDVGEGAIAVPGYLRNLCIAETE